MNTLHIQANPRPHEPPFVLAAGTKIIDSVFQFLRLLYLRGIAPKTIRAYAFDLLSFYRFMEVKNLSPAVRSAHGTWGISDADPDTLQPPHFADFILAQRKENAAPRTINRRLTVVRSFLNSQDQGYGDRLFNKTGPVFYKGTRNKALLGKSRIAVKKKSFTVKVPSVLITPLSPSEIKKFLLGLRKYRDQAILSLMLLCGLRSCEILSLDVNDIDFIDDQIRVKGKGGKERVLPISATVRQALMRYLDYERPECSHTSCFVVLKGPHRGQPLTAAGLRTVFRHRRNRANLKQANPHKFRHTFCTNMIGQGVSLPVVQKLMGHADIEVTMGYVHLSATDVAKEYHRAMATLQANN